MSLLTQNRERSQGYGPNEPGLRSAPIATTIQQAAEFFGYDHAEPSATVSPRSRVWRFEFFRVFAVVYIICLAMFLVRNNFKAAQPLLIEQYGLSITQLGAIGLAFSLTYGIGKLVLGYAISGLNAKRVIGLLLVLAGVTTLVLGLVLISRGAVGGLFIMFFGLNGLCQSAITPGSYATINNWIPSAKRGQILGLWNSSQNIGGAVAGFVALWGTLTFFSGDAAGMFIFPALIAIAVGLSSWLIGYNAPTDKGWNTAEAQFHEAASVEDNQAEELSKREIFTRWVMRNPWVLLLGAASIFTYAIRAGIDSWAPIYVSQELGFDAQASVSTIFYFEAGAFAASLLWGWVSDKVGGRRSLIGALAMAGIIGCIVAYQHARGEIMVYVTLGLLGLLVAAPQLLIGISVINFVPRSAIAMAYGLTGSFGYLFGDAMAKVTLALIADPQGNGLSIGGLHLHGWNATFVVLQCAAAIGVAILATVAFREERKLRASAV